MDRAGHQTRCQTVEIIVAASKNDFAHGRVVRQHTDNELTVEQIADIRRWPETKRLKLANPIRASDAGNHPTPAGREIRSHRHSNVTKTDKADFAHDRRTVGRPRAAPALMRQILGGFSEGDSGTGFVLGHSGSWSGATARSNARLATDTPRYLIASGLCACLGLPRV